MTVLGTTRCRTTSYHPQANGLVERFHRQLKAAIKTHATAPWTESLPLVLLGICTALRGDYSVWLLSWFTVCPFAYLVNFPLPPLPQLLLVRHISLDSSCL